MPKTKIKLNTEEIPAKKVETSNATSPSDLSFLIVEKSKILESSDLNLSASRYRVTTDYTNAKWPMVELGEVCEVYGGSTPKRTESEYWTDGDIPWFTIEDIREQGRIIKYTNQKITKLGFENSSVKLLPKNSILICCTASIGEYAFSEIELTTNQQFNGLVVKDKYLNELNPKFLFCLASGFKDTLIALSGVTSFGFVSGTNLKTIQIPLPPLSVQEEIVREIEQYQKIIDGAKQVIENWKPKIDIDPEWPKVKLGEVCETSSGGTPLKSKEEYYTDGKIPWLRSGEVFQGEIYSSEIFITEEGLKGSSAKLFPVNTVLVAMYGATAGQVGILKFESSTNQAICGILPNKNFMPEFLYFQLLGLKGLMISLSGGGAQPNISQMIVKDLEIYLPTLEIQQKIVSEIEKERELVEGNKKLVEVYKNKVKNVIQKIWS